MQKLALLVALAPALAAQTYYIPDNSATTGTCNVIPFGSTSTTSGFATCLTQQIYTAADLGNLPGLITGLEFAPCGTGKSRFGRLQVTLDLLPANSTLQTTFASNLTPNATVVLDATDYAWHTTANTWSEIGLQNFFFYDGSSDLVVQVLADRSLSPAGFHRSSTRPRVYSTGWAGTPPASGTYSGTTAQKIGISMQMARASTYGDGCPGSNALPPRLQLTGAPQLGQTLNLDLAQAPANAPSFLLFGLGNGAPYPLDLGVFGLPGCFQYFTPAGNVLAVADGAGRAAWPFPVPNVPAFAGALFYAQWACIDPPANATGATTSDYARVLVGN